MKQSNSLADRVIKNSYYQVLLQLFTFVFPIILTPLIISKIGEVQFGIYALILGFIAVFGLFDLSFSSSFIVFISRYFEKKDEQNLNSYFNTGLFFYIAFSIIICTAGFLLTQPILSLLNIPADLKEVSKQVYLIGLTVFFVNSVFAIFPSVLISIQKMYLTSAAGIAGGIINFVLTVIALYSGYGLMGIMLSQLVTAIVVSIINFIFAIRMMPELRINPASITSGAAKEMGKFGSQMQLSKLASFASEKYDEFLLAHFTTLSNVTYFNIASRISRAGRIIPFQIIPQIAPVASGLKAKEEDSKLTSLFETASKYLLLATAPVFVFIFTFSDLIIRTWMGSGFEISADILKVLAFGQLFNLAFSAPGNSIIPNTGNPKFQMYEGLINLAFNIVLSFLLIKYYGIFGAALGSVLSMVISSLYVFFKSAGHFRKDVMKMISGLYLLPISASINAGIASYILYFLSNRFLIPAEGRFSGLIYLVLLVLLFVVIFFFIIFRSKYINEKDKILIAKTLIKLLPGSKLLPSNAKSQYSSKTYLNEKVSLFIVTHSRLGMLRQCLSSLLPTLHEIDYELLIIDNASDDGTKDFLESFSKGNERIRLIRNDVNIGTNAKSQAAELTTGDFIIGIDDDVIEFPERWAERMIKGYKTISGMGYLSSDVVVDETTNGAKHPDECYNRQEFGDDVALLVGPTGGWCFMLSREVYEKVGKLLTFPDRIFFAEDGDYVNRIRNMGYRYGILEGVKVYHATGEFHNKEYSRVFNEKYVDYKKGEPLSYKLRNRLKNLFAYRRYALKIDELSKQSLDWQ